MEAEAEARGTNFEATSRLPADEQPPEGEGSPTPLTKHSAGSWLQTALLFLALQLLLVGVHCSSHAIAQHHAHSTPVPQCRALQPRGAHFLAPLLLL